MNTVEGSQFSRNDFLRRVSKKLLTFPGALIAFVGKYPGVVLLFCVTQIIFSFE